MSLPPYLKLFEASQSYLKLISHSKPEIESHSEEGWAPAKLICVCVSFGVEKGILTMAGEPDKLETGQSQLR